MFIRFYQIWEATANDKQDNMILFLRLLCTLILRLASSADAADINLFSLLLTVILVLKLVEIDRYAPTGFRGPDSAPGQGIEVQP